MDKNNSKNKDMEMGRNNVTLSNTGAAAGKGRKGCRWRQWVAGLLLWGFSVTALALAAPTGVQISGRSDTTDTSYTLSWNAVTGAGTYLITGSVDGVCVTFYCLLQSNSSSDRTVASSELPSQFRAPGTIVLQVRACDSAGQNCGSITSVTVQIDTNTAPRVTLSSPADDAEYRTGDTVTLSAAATDSQDNISSVKFYVDGSLVNTDTSSPYSYAWTATLGSHSIRARVTDSGGLSAYSSTHDITVTAPLAAPTGVRIAGKSNSFDTSYELHWNAVTGAGAYWVVGSVNGRCVTPYCLLVYTSASDRVVSSSELPSQFREPGTLQLQVTACNSDRSYCGPNTPVNLEIVANTAPSVTLTSPADDAEYRTGDTVTLSGTATDAQDNISSVKFYVDGSLVNTDTSSPYSYAWTATLGSHSVYARVTDSGGLSANSSTHDITVTAPLAAPTGVRIVGKSDDVDSSYELHWNAVSRAGAYWVVGSVNGACVTPYCLLVYTSASDRIVSSSELPSQFREPGMLQLQVTACNSDRSYCGPLTPVNLEIVANTAPTVALTAPAVNSNLPVGTSVTLEATAADSDGSITKVEFFVDGVRVGTDTSSPYQYNWVSNTLAIYSLTAKATDNAGGVTTSEAVSVRRTPVAPAPTISNTVNNYDGDYTLSWNHTTGAQGYWIAAIKDGVGHGGAYGLVTYVAAEAGTSSDITSAELMTAYPSRDYSAPGEYEFLVSACTSQTGICSDVGRADITVEELAAPANLSISNDTNNYDGDYTLSWNHSTGAHGYRISASRTANGVTDEFETYLEAVAGVSPAISSAELTAVYPDQDYTDPGAYEFSIVACTAQTDGVCSTAATAEIMVLEIAAPANLSISNTASNTDGVYTLSWDNVAGAQGYVIGALKNEAFHGGDYGYVTYVPRESGAQSNITSAELDTAQPSHSYTTEAKYEYLVVACTAQTGGVCSEASRASIRVYSEISNGFTADSAPLPTAVTNASAQESSDKVGASAGQFRVNESGAATYTMPLTLLAGTAGVEPPLRFNYNSQGGSGLMGRGWSIGGLSAIERCRQTLHQDRKAMPITWSDKDRFCLDGQRLVLDDPANGTYGAVGTVYRTELDSFAKVTSVGGGPNPGNPDYFKVERKDGSVSYYGATPDTSDTDAKLLDSSTNTDPKTFRWALKKFRDNMDNPIWYIYANDDNGQRIDEVRYAYGANETTPDAGYKAVVKFAYASTARTDAAKAYIAGYGFVNDKLLTKVTVKSGPEMTATEIRHYKLSYQADSTVTEDKVTRLEKIEECKDTTCYLDTEFTWPVPVSPFPAGSPAATASLTLLDRNYPSVLDYEFADINGDGATDIVWQALDIDEGDTDHELWYALSSADGMMVAGTFSDGTDRIFLHENYAEDSLGSIRMEVLDYNADGRQDVALFHHVDSKWKVFLSTYTTVGTSGEWRLGSSSVDTSVVNEHVTFADIDSDGLVDAVRATAPVAATDDADAVPAGLAVRYLRLRDPATLPATERAQAYEFDADEVAPAYQASTNETLVIPAGDDLSDLFFAGRSLVTPNALTVLQPAGDFNGDGKSEIYVRYKTVETAGVLGGSTSRPFYNHRLVTQKSDGGARTLLSRYSNPGSVSSEDALVFGDINGDGLTDIVYAPPLTSGQSLTALRTVKYWLNTGAASTTDQLLDTLLANAPTISLRWNRAATTGYQAPPPRLVDMNHDGFLDLTWYDAHENKFRVAYWDGPMASFGAAQELFTTLTVDDEELNAHLLLDMDGDGWMDRIHMAGETLKVYASANKGADRSVITGITNGLDAVTTIDYATLSDADVYERLGISLSTQTMHFCLSPDLGGACSDFPYSAPNLAKFYTMLNGAWTGEDILGNNAAGTARQSPVLELIGPMPVVKKVTGSAPGWKLASTGTSGNSNDASATSSISYQYGQAKIQASGRGFLGFERLKTIDEQTRVTTTTQYRQDFPYIGRPLSTEVRTEGGKLLRNSTSTWNLEGYETTWAATARDDGTAKLGALRPVLSKTEESRYALDTTSTPATQTALSKVVTTNTHDAFGNLNEIVTKTHDVADTVVARQTTTNEYHDSGFGTEEKNRQAGRLTKSTVKTERLTAGTTTFVANTRIATFDYYDSDDTRGMLQTETVQPGTQEQLVTTHTYDSRGNTKKVVTVGKVGKAGTTATQQRYTEYKYDTDMRYLEYTKESFGGVSYQLNKVLERDKAGRVERSQSVAPDGAGTAASQETGMAYGALGRPFLEYNTSTGARGTTYYSATVTGVCPATAQYRTETRNAGGGISQVCYDKLAREVRRRSQGFAGGTGYYQVDTQYDILGRVKRVSEPHPSGAMTIHWTENEYDILGRLTRIDHPHTTNDTTIVYSADSSVTGAVETVVTNNAKGQESTEYRNALGEVVKVENPLTASVTYAYDAAGNLKQTVANGVTTTISYDVLGRKQSMTDPDKGQWSYQYNAFGELVEQTSANGVVSTLTHDAQGRRLSRTDARSATTLNATTWSYDTQTMADTVAAPGQLTRTVHTISSEEQVGSHSVALAYDTLGRLMGREVIIDGNAALTFEEQYTYPKFVTISPFTRSLRPNSVDFATASP